MKEKLLNSYAFKTLLHGYKNIFCYTGRESKRAFGFFILTNFILFLISIFIATLLARVIGGLVGGILILVIVAGFYLSTLSFNVRRLHDAGHSGKWCLFYLIAAAIVWIVSYILPSTPGSNQYGEEPK